MCLATRLMKSNSRRGTHHRLWFKYKSKSGLFIFFLSWNSFIWSPFWNGIYKSEWSHCDSMKFGNSLRGTTGFYNSFTCWEERPSDFPTFNWKGIHAEKKLLLKLEIFIYGNSRTCKFTSTQCPQTQTHKVKVSLAAEYSPQGRSVD